MICQCPWKKTLIEKKNKQKVKLGQWAPSWTSSSNPLKSRRPIEDINTRRCLRVELCMKLFPILQRPLPTLLINVHTLFPLKSAFSYMFFSQSFQSISRASSMWYAQLMFIWCLNNALNMDFSPYNMKILISQVNRRSPGNGVVHCAITNKGPAHANSVVKSCILAKFTDQILNFNTLHSYW